MQIRLYIDEDTMSRSLMKGLRARGIDVISVSDEDTVGLDDAAQLELATKLNRVLCTSNTGDFYQLHTEYLEQGKIHAGIIFVSQQRYSIGEQIRRLLNLISKKSAEEIQCQVEFLSAW